MKCSFLYAHYYHANVNITTTPSETEITTEQPVSGGELKVHKLYYYKGNYNASDANIGYTGTPTFSSFSTQFADVTSKSGSTTLSNIYPGHKMTFAIDLYTSAVSAVYLTLEHGQYTPGYSASKLQTSNSGDSSMTYVYMATAINIYTAIQYGASTLSDTPPAENTYSSDLFDFRAHFASMASYDYPLISQTTGSLQYIRMFYTIQFSNGTDTYYKEYTNSAGTSPLDYDTPGNTRYFKKDPDNGNSLCYAGLSFGITRLKISGS